MSESKPNCTHVVRTQGEVARHAGVAVQTVRDWRRTGMPGRPGHWDLLEIEVWRRERRRAGGDETPAGEIPTDPKRKREHYLAELARLKVEAETRRLIPVDEHERALTERSAWITAVLLAIPSSLAPLVAGKTVTEARRIMQQQCWKLQEQAYGRTDD